VTHQTGAADVDEVRAAYAALGLPARVEPFITDMAGAYATADVVISRAGAMSCAEVTAVGLPAILVPYPHAADDHQRRNAEVLVAAGAGGGILHPAPAGPPPAAPRPPPRADPLLPAPAGAPARRACAPGVS